MADIEKPDWLQATTGQGTTSTIIGLSGRTVTVDGGDKREPMPVSAAPTTFGSAERVIGDALAGFRAAIAQAEAEIAKLETEAEVHRNALEHYESETKKLNSIMLSFEYDKKRED